VASWDFPATEPVDLQIRIPAGTIKVVAGDTRTSTVEIVPPPGRPGADGALGGIRVVGDAGRLVVTVPDRLRLLGGGSPRLQVTVTVPHGSSCKLHTASADIGCTGELSALSAHTASGNVAAQHVTGPVDVHTASGDVRLVSSGPLRAKTVSGDVRIGAAAGDVSCQTVSGQVEIASVRGGRIDIKTVSGDITVAVVRGIGVQLDLSALSGMVSSDLQHSGAGGAAEATLTCRTVSGDIRVSRAAQGADA
jgi:Putative adhesin